MIELKLARCAARRALSCAPGKRDGLKSAIAGPVGEAGKRGCDAELGVSGCYGAIHTAAYAAVAAGANDEEIVAEIRAAAGDGRKFPSWSPAYVKEKTSPFFLASMIANARRREADRPGRIEAEHRRVASASRARGHAESRRDAKAPDT